MKRTFVLLLVAALSSAALALAGDSTIVSGSGSGPCGLCPGSCPLPCWLCR